MYFWICVSIMALLAGIFWSIYYREPGPIFASIWFIIAMLLWTLLVGIALMVFVPTDSYVYNSTETKELLPVNDDYSEGEIFLTKDFDKDSVYYYYAVEDSEGGGKNYCNVNSNTGIKVYTNEKEKPYVAIIKKTYSNFFVKMFFLPLDRYEYEFHIPPNSLGENLVLELE